MSTSMRLKGVATALEDVRQRVEEGMRERLVQRRAAGRIEVSDEEIGAIAGIAGTLARLAAADGVAEAYQWGVNRSASTEDFERPTNKPPAPEGKPPGSTG